MAFKHLCVATGVLGLLLILRLFCVARDYGRDRPQTNEQFITQQRHAGPFYQPPTVPVQVPVAPLTPLVVQNCCTVMQCVFCGWL